MELLGGFGIAGALWYGSRQIAAGNHDAGRSSCRSSARVFLMYGPAKKLSRVNANLQQAIAAAERIFEMLDTHTEVHGAAGRRRRWRRSSATIEFRDVGFGYDEGRWAGFCAASRSRVDAGQMVAIVGRSGAGKTDAGQPAAAVLRRHARRDSDRRRRHPREVTLASLRQQIGIVTQETVLFDDTVASNIAYGTAGAPARGGSRRRRARPTPTISSPALPQRLPRR